MKMNRMKDKINLRQYLRIKRLHIFLEFPLLKTGFLSSQFLISEKMALKTAILQRIVHHTLNKFFAERPSIFGLDGSF